MSLGMVRTPEFLPVDSCVKGVDLNFIIYNQIKAIIKILRFFEWFLRDDEVPRANNLFKCGGNIFWPREIKKQSPVRVAAPTGSSRM